MYPKHMMATRVAARSADAALPGIRANRQQIDDRFPVLGFTIDTARLPFYEVILTIDPKLFDPRRETERTVDNFYSSRADSGLIEADASVYVVPTAVVRRFATARAVFYTLVCYVDRALAGATYAHDPEELSKSAPSVQIAPGFQGRTLSNVLGVPAEYLRPVTAPSGAALASAVDSVEDVGEGEDGYGVAERAHSLAADDEWEDHDEQLVAGGYETSDTETADDADDDSEWTAEDENSDADPADGEVAASGSAVTYDDGFGEFPGGDAAVGYGEEAGDESVAHASESAYPEGSEAPRMLEDEDYVDPSETDDVSSSYGDDAQKRLPLDIPAKRSLLERILSVAGPPDGFATTLPDAEYAGDMGDQPARGKYHRGLSYGIALFNQDSGELGNLLLLMEQRDGAKFRAVFGPHAQELIAVTTRVGPSAAVSPDGRGVRVQPVSGEDLWSNAWIARFKAAAQPDLFGAGRPQLFNGAQNELAVRLYLEPMMPLARLIGLDGQRALGLLFDRALQMGAQRASGWVLNAVSPIQTPAQRQQALAALGHTSIAGFQNAYPGAETDGEWGPRTHAAMLGALRALGSGSPVPLPQREDEWLAALQRRAAQEPWATRFERVHAALEDVRHAF